MPVQANRPAETMVDIGRGPAVGRLRDPFVDGCNVLPVAGPCLPVCSFRRKVHILQMYLALGDVLPRGWHVDAGPGDADDRDKKRRKRFYLVTLGGRKGKGGLR